MALTNTNAEIPSDDGVQHGTETQEEDESESVAESKPAFEPKSDLESRAIIGPARGRAFTCFPKLAPELRIRIWKEACNVTRNVDLWVCGITSLSDDTECLAGDPHFFYSSCRPPSILGICRESRSEGLKYYTLDFGVKVEINEHDAISYTISTPPKVYFNWKCDRLCLMNPQGFGYVDYDYDWSGDLLKRCEEKKLRFMAINVWIDDDYLDPEVCWNMIPWKSNLDQLVIFSCPVLNLESVPGTMSFVDVKVEGVENEDYGDCDFGYESGGNWRLMQVRHHMEFMSEKLAARLKTGGSGLDLRSCDVKITPYKPTGQKSQGYNRANLVVKSCIVSG